MSSASVTYDPSHSTITNFTVLPISFRLSSTLYSIRPYASVVKSKIFVYKYTPSYAIPVNMPQDGYDPAAYYPGVG